MFRGLPAGRYTASFELVTVFGRFPRSNVRFEEGLSSPTTREFTASAGSQVGRGYAKATYVVRRVSNFVEDFITLENGSTASTSDVLAVPTSRCSIATIRR